MNQQPMVNHPQNFPVQGPQNQMTNNAQEIDLLELLLKSIMIVKRHKWLVVSLFSTSLLIGIFAAVKTSAVYTSNLVLNVDALSSEQTTELIEDFALRVKRDSRQIKDIKVETAFESSDKIRGYVISAEVTDPAVLIILQNKLVRHISENNFLKEKRETQIKGIKEKISVLKTEEEQLTNVLANTITTRLPNENFSVADISKLKMQIAKERIELENQLINYEPVAVVQSFSTYKGPSYTSKLKFLGISIVAGIFLMVMVITILEIKALLRGNSHEEIVSKRTAFSQNTALRKSHAMRPKVGAR